ncbi:hypothetical protein UZ73_17740 [Alcaligenes faecalis]|nr:hypothetical protein UZ73_17740 [Alcaligenes faecalis]
MADPMSDLRRHIDQPADLHGQLGIESTINDMLRQEKERHKILTNFPNAGSFTKIYQDYERQRELLNLPEEEAKRLELLNHQSDLHKSLSATLEAQQAYKRLFRLPKISELGRIAHEAMENANLARAVLGTEDHLQTAMATMRSPWLLVNDSLASSKALSEIIAIGSGINHSTAFDHDFAAALRSSLGDWRYMPTPTPEPLLDPVLRSDLYAERGFDPALTDFTPLAFDEGLRVAGLRGPESVESDNVHDEGLARAQEAFQLLQRFEVELRRFISQEMLNYYGISWMKQQLPPDMLSCWVEKERRAMASGQAAHPLIDFADFTDYSKIISRKDNWDNVFKRIFKRKEDMQESFQRLFPIRIATMHCRPIMQDDELLLLVETKRIFKAIGAQ